MKEVGRRVRKERNQGNN